jgi:glycopeptide antibiotics resistance protein
MEPEKRNWLTVVLFVIYILVLAGVILFKLPFYSGPSEGIRVINLIPFQGSFEEYGGILWEEIRNNILVFIPLGIYICMLKGSWPFVKKVLPIIGLTLAFEVTQFVFAIGRTDITDILDNTLGGIIGIGVYALLFKAFKDRTSKIVNMLALVITVLVIAYLAYLFFLSHFVMGRPPG